MAIGQVIVLSALFAQAFAAPSGCIESCTFHQASYQSRNTAGGYQDHADLVQGGTHLNDHDYARPGNWTEHNQYSTDGGRGKIHEERGQYEEGAKKVRYFKKNFTSSYGNVNALGAADLDGQRGYDSLRIPSNQHFDSQSAHSQLGQTVTKERVHSQQTQSMRIGSQSERLEDFGEYSGYSQAIPTRHGVDAQTIDRQQHGGTEPGNWSRVDSHKTDGGRGRVFEEEGQYVTGPKKVRYYKKNYTSSYSTSGVPQDGIDSTKLDELQRNLHRELDNFRREFHQGSSSLTGHTASATHVGSLDLTQEAVGFRSDDLQTAESDGYRQQSGYRRVPSGETVHHYADQQQRETLIDTRQQVPHTYPAADTYGTESQRTYQSHETHVSRVHPVPVHPTPGLTHVPLTRTNYQTDLHSAREHHVHLDDTQRAEVLGAHRSSVVQNQLAEGSHHVYNPSSSYPSAYPSTYPGGHGETRRYEEHWSSSSRTGGSATPTFAHDASHTSDHSGHHRGHYDRDAYNEQRGRYHAAHGYDSHARTSESSYNTAYRANSGQLVTGSLDLGQAAGQQGADCTEETQQYRQETRYHRKYKRDDHHGYVQQHRDDQQQLEDLTQQSEQFAQGQLEYGQQTVDHQQAEDLTQQNKQFTQQTSGNLEFGQQTVDNQHLEDLRQQSERFTQQTEGQLEFGQQTVDNQELKDLMQQTQRSDDFTQQTNGKLEFGQQTVGDQHLEDLTQQTEQFQQQAQGSDDFMQQSIGKLEFGQQTVGDQHLEDLTQQTEQFQQQTQGSDDFTQQSSGKLEFGQQTVGNQHLEDLTQQTQESDFAQQMRGKLEFGQQTVGDQHLEDLTQQIEQFQQKQTADSDDFTPQTIGELKYGQQADDSQQSEQLTQQLEQSSQRVAKSDDFTQQTAGQFEFGKQADSNQHFKDLMQQSEQFTQQADELEFGQHAVDNQYREDLTKLNEWYAQQTGGTNDFTQQTQSMHEPTDPKNRHFKEFNEHSEDLTQQTGGFDDFTQQTTGQMKFGQEMQQPDKPRPGDQHLGDFTQQNEDLTQQVGGFDDFAQQTAGHLEYELQREKQRKPSWPPTYNTQPSISFSQQNDWSTDPSQQSYQYPSYNNEEQSEWQLRQTPQRPAFDRDFTQQIDHDQQSATDVIKPAPKPKPRQRYHQKQESTPPHTDGTDIFEPVEVSPEADIGDFRGRLVQGSGRLTDPRSRDISAQSQGTGVFDNEKENMDRLHWVHKSNDATVGQQWHYAYHPSDLTNIEGSHDDYYPQRNADSMPQRTDDVQQQSRPFDFSQQETQDKNTFEDIYRHPIYSSQLPQSVPSQNNKYDQQLGAFQQSEIPSFADLVNQNSEEAPSKVIPLQHTPNSQGASDSGKLTATQTAEGTEDKPEARILEAYGGGPYDGSRSDDIYHRVRPNPSATLPPIFGEDPWDIREKPRERMTPGWIVRNLSPVISKNGEPTTEEIETTTPIIETTTAPASFWSRLGHKITNTYDKAKEKAKEIFG